MTLILKLDLDMVKMYRHTKNEVSMLRGSKVYSLNRQKHRQTHRQTDRQTHTQTDTQTDRHTDMTENITYPHTRVVITRWHKMPYNCTVEGQYQLQGTLSVPSIRDSTIFSHIVKLLHGNVHKETSPSNIFTSKLA